MSEDKAKLSREERLALQLRENLKRRKAQARAMTSGETGQSALSKSDPSR